MEPIPPPPPIYVNYPRAQGGSLEEFDGLLRAFKVTGYSFLYVVLVNISSQVVMAVVNNQTLAWSLLGLEIIAAAAIASWGARTYAKAVNKNLTTATILACLSVVVPCMFLIYLSVMQQDMIGRLRAYGLKYRFLRFNKKEVAAIRERLSAQQSSPPTI
ncbi:MAG: hypothetical protein JSS65_01465 [Armatimonadetes bacterium]|nr:hypothetical protein [Armatimonadota bacterium]